MEAQFAERDAYVQHNLQEWKNMNQFILNVTVEYHPDDIFHNMANFRKWQKGEIEGDVPKQVWFRGPVIRFHMKAVQENTANDYVTTMRNFVSKLNLQYSYTSSFQ
jgi:hypothetical protein